jgi:putative tryptophan/tyrosine transport system substrate-binding protein
MNRRAFISLFGGAAAWPLAARAQQPALPVIGFLSVGSPNTNNLAGLRKGLSEEGYLEGHNFVFEHRSTEEYDRLPALAADLVARRVAVVFTFGNLNAAQAAKAATATIPIVFTVGVDPVMFGLVGSLNRPGANVTGVTYLVAEMTPKRLELLHELLPRAPTIAFLANPANPATEAITRDLGEAARKLGKKVVLLRASTADEIDAAFSTLVEERADGLLVNGDSFFNARRSQLIVLTARHAIPAVYFDTEFTRQGGLMSYSDDRFESFRQAGIYVGRILKGQKPADLSVLQPTKFELAINLRTAKALSVEIPPTLLARADEVIE